MDSDKSQAKDDLSIPREKSLYDDIPMLLVPREENNGCREWSIYSVLVNQFIAKLFLPLHDGRFSGFSQGWLVTINKNFEITLYKPFTVREGKIENSITLPPLSPPKIENSPTFTLFFPPLGYPDDYYQYYIHKVTIFTPDPVKNPNDLICVVIFGGMRDLAYIRPTKYNRWKRVKDRTHIIFNDVAYNDDNQFYALTEKCELVSFKDTPSFITYVKSVTDEKPCIGNEEDHCYNKYLVKLKEGEFLQVQRYLDEEYDFENPETKKFRVFKLSVDGPRRSWVETKNLGDVALFLGENSSMSVLASNIAGCQGNCIYFSPIRAGFSTPIYEPKDMGVYNLESGTITSFAIDPEIIAKFYTRSPIWVSQ